jgi:flagellar protein FlgJ
MTPVSLSQTLASTAPQTDRQQLHEAAQQFEAILLRQFLAAARKADFGGGFLSNEAMGTFRQMQDDHFADVASHTGAFGMAAMIEAQLAAHLPREGA